MSNHLTPREKSVATLVAEAMQNKEIAQALRISERSVKNRLNRIYEKRGFSNRVELAVWVLSRQAAGQELS